MLFSLRFWLTRQKADLKITKYFQQTIFRLKKVPKKFSTHVKQVQIVSNVKDNKLLRAYPTSKAV
jgi:hypothetical protein